MPSKKKKYNARFPAGRIKKIMQTDEEIGKVAQAVPVIISRTLELFVESLLKNAMQITNAKNAKTLTPTHMKQCILSESRFDFLKDLVKNIPDVLSTEEDLGTTCGNISPGTPCSTKAYNDYSCFQFQKSSDSSSSKSLCSNSQQPLISQTSQPKFYKEIPIGSESCENKICGNSSSPNYSGATLTFNTSSQVTNQYLSYPQMSKNSDSSPVIKTLSGCNNKKLYKVKHSNSFKKSDNANASIKEDEDENDEPEENGYYKEKKIKKTVTIDEDYDT